MLGEWRARTAEQLPALTVELVTTLAALHAEPLAAAAIQWVTALTVAALPEAQTYTRACMTRSPGCSARWRRRHRRGAGRRRLARYELLLLAELGFGLDLDRCVASGGRE